MDGTGSFPVAHTVGLLPTELTGMWGWILLRSSHQGRGSPPAPAPTKQRPAWDNCPIPTQYKPASCGVFEPSIFTPNPTGGQPTPPPTRGGFPPQKVNTCVHPEVPMGVLFQPLCPSLPPSNCVKTGSPTRQTNPAFGSSPPPKVWTAPISSIQRTMPGDTVEAAVYQVWPPPRLPRGLGSQG